MPIMLDILTRCRGRPLSVANPASQSRTTRLLVLSGHTWASVTLGATERKDLPVQDVAAAGGWKTVKPSSGSINRQTEQPRLAVVEAG